MKEISCGSIIFDNGKVLLIKSKSREEWGFPKGHVEEGETEEQTAIREVKEETNIDIEIIKGKKYIMSYIVKDNVNKDVILFLSKKIGGEIKVQEEEVSEAKWVDIDKVLDFLTYDNSKDLYKKVLKDLK